ncbi:eukaryotic translation initiation factor 2-alpha kinase 1 [Nephila pilipes]|uniref:Eukaryotic translation initiation factor 2-alpha kinase 1 n=1 Tax=Nephila pilipes TaxID=299642 RepID=A0A8X6JM74_NEPPI|nr:eukaryotic translation initiation factor 2-alpha kinase 1 [Nephila pilipes]
MTFDIFGSKRPPERKLLQENTSSKTSKLNMSNFSKDKEELLRKTLTLFDGDIIVNNVPDSQEVKKTDSTFLLHILIETLCCILEKNEHQRQQLFECICSSLTKQKHSDPIPFENLAPIRREYASVFYEHIKKVHNNLTPSIQQDAYSERADSVVIPKTSLKYKDMFDEIEIIGKGGFGTVCRTKHRIDNIIYAVKKIIFTYREDSDYNKVMREVKSFAGLSHMNVVGYNNAWVQTVEQQGEHSDKPDIEDFTTSNESSSTSSGRSDEMGSQIFQKSSFYGYSNRFYTSSQSDGIVFCASSNREESCSSSFLARNETGFTNQNESEEESEDEDVHPKLKVKMMLCIQMEFCDCDLRIWLVARNEGKPLPFQKSVVDIFKEILSGVSYIHSKSVIHRDLKPQNIFFSTKDCVMKVGDFGLATLGHTNIDESHTIGRHSTNLGTIPYAAPEQRKKSNYDSKVDMYSLGIILIELLLKIKTMAEFSSTINEIKSGKLPEELNKHWPEFGSLVQNLVQEEPKLRMNAKDVLNMSLFKYNHVEENRVLRTKVKDLENELAHKEQQFQQLLDEVKTLRLKINE